MHEELSLAEILEKELVNRHKKLEESMKPALLKLQEQLNNNKDVVDDEVVEACIKEEKPDEIVEMLRRKAISMNKMNRTRLLGFMKTVLRFREQFLDTNQQTNREITEEMAERALNLLGRPTIDWVDFAPWEARFLRDLLRDIEGIPLFVLDFLDQYLGRLFPVSDDDSS